jgi:hypothetical protein
MFRELVRTGPLALVLLVAGCASMSEVTEPRVDGQFDTGEAPTALRTQGGVFDVRATRDAYEATIDVTFTNPTEGPVYIPTCREPNPPVLQKWEGGSWVAAYRPVVLGCLGPPVVIEAGQSYDYTYRVTASRRPNTYPRFMVREIPGTYRLQWDMLRTWTPDATTPDGRSAGLGEPLPADLTTSNTFDLRLR